MVHTHSKHSFFPLIVVPISVGREGGLDGERGDRSVWYTNTLVMCVSHLHVHMHIQRITAFPLIVATVIYYFSANMQHFSSVITILSDLIS